MKPSRPVRGVLVVWTRPSHPELTDEDFNADYNDVHLPNFVDSGIADLALRYKNVDAKAEWPYLAIYRLPDVEALKDSERLSRMKAEHPLMPGKEPGTKGGEWRDCVDVKMASFETVQTHEGFKEKHGRGPALVLAQIDYGDEIETEVDEWYKKQVGGRDAYVQRRLIEW
jgi:hypothetical protein